MSTHKYLDNIGLGQVWEKIKNITLAKDNTTSYTPTANYHPATKKYVDDATAGITTDLSGLTDTTISSPSNGQILTYNSTSSKWENMNAPKEIVYVTFTRDTNDSTKYIPNKTYDEIESAYFNGAIIMAKYLTSIIPLASIADTTAVVRRMTFLNRLSNSTDIYSWNRSNNYVTLRTETTAGSLSFSNGTITLTNAYGNTSSIALPIYNGGVSS